MDALVFVFGEGKDLDVLQMAARAFITFIATLIFIRIAGRRSFGQRSSFDYVVAILLGATLSRFIVGASPAIPTMAASLVLVALHRLLGWLCVRSTFVAWIIGGSARRVYHDENFDDQQMAAALLTRDDVHEALRDKLHITSLEQIDTVLLERNGEISLVLKPDAGLVKDIALKSANAGIATRESTEFDE